MTQKPHVTIVMGAYNRLEFLKLALDSIRHEVASIPHEIIVVDGGSDDGSLEWLITQKDVLTIVQHNRGHFLGKPIPRRSWGYFMNLAFKTAQADYILMMSDDTIFHPGAVQTGLDFVRDQQARGQNVGAVPFYFHDVGKEPLTQYKIFTLFGTPMLNHGIYVRDALEKIGYADETTFSFYGSDSDICFKLRHAGYDILPCEAALMLHCEQHPMRQMNTPSDRWVQDLTALVDKWKGILIPPDAKINAGQTDIIAITYTDPDNLARVFDVALAPTPDTPVSVGDVSLNQIESRLQSLLASVRHNIFITQKTQTYFEQTRSPLWQVLASARWIAPLRGWVKRRLQARAGVAQADIMPPVTPDDDTQSRLTHMDETLQAITTAVQHNIQLSQALYEAWQQTDKRGKP
jgi:hypothetical protein